MALVLWAMIGISHALSPPPPLPVQDLIDFYLATDGDNWHNNDGWLDEDRSVCDWHGITCGPVASHFGGFQAIVEVRLPGNNLHGSISDTHILAIVDEHLDLSNNRIGGQIERLPQGMSHIDLSGNELTGPLPGIEDFGLSSMTPGSLDRLDLSGNRFEGEVPDSWQDLALGWLDLADNLLEQGHVNAFGSMRTGTSSRGYLNLAGNRFSAPLTSLTIPPLYLHDEIPTGGGLNVCWNDFGDLTSVMEDWVGNRHVGGADFQRCLGRERMALGPEISGSWFKPARAGKGLSLQLLDTGAPLVYWFSFDLEGQQQWLYGVGKAGEEQLQWPELLETFGQFDQGVAGPAEEHSRPTARLRMDRTDWTEMHLERVYTDWGNCGPPVQPPNPPSSLCVVNFASDRLDHVQLTRMAGTTCTNQHPDQWISGAWFNPARSGEGFMIEVTEQGDAVVYWFTYQPDGSGRQAWMMGDGPVHAPASISSTSWSRSIDIDHLLQPVGGQHGPGFDGASIDYLDWGSLSLNFHGPDFGEVHFDSHFEDYGSGSYPIERLARPLLAECNDELSKETP